MLLYVWAGKRAKWPREPHKHVSPQRLHTGKSPAKTPAALSRGPGNVKVTYYSPLPLVWRHCVPGALQTPSLSPLRPRGVGVLPVLGMRLREVTQLTRHHTAHPRNFEKLNSRVFLFKYDTRIANGRSETVALHCFMAFLANTQAGLGHFTQRTLPWKEEEVGTRPCDNPSCGTRAVALMRFHSHNVICPQTILRDRIIFF